MNWKMIFCVLCILLIGLPVHASEETYIVKLNDTILAYLESEERTSSQYCLATKQELEEYLEAGIVEYYEIDHKVELFDDVDNGNSSSVSWNLDTINTQTAWEIGCYGNEIKIAVIDSGVYAHPNFSGNVLSGYNYLNDTTDTTDNIGHGTYVAGIISANCEEIRGVSPRAQIVPLKCFDTEQNPETLMIAKAIRDAVDIYQCDVINMSFGISKSLITTTLTDAVSYAIQNGCILVASVGNDGQSNAYYPAKYEKVIGVGSINQQRKLSSFSQKNSTVDVVAPGEDIQSISLPGFYENDGTSFSAPHISAVAAIAKCIDKNINSDDFMYILSECCEDLGNSGYDYFYGYGLIDINKMIEKLLEETDVFLSPIDQDRNILNAVLYNNSNISKTLTWIVAKYNDKHFEGLQSQEVRVEPKQKILLNVQSNNITKYFIWEDMEFLIPVTKAREYKNN